MPTLLTNVLLGIAQILAWGGSFFLVAVLADPITKDTGWAKPYVYGSLSVGLLVSAFLAPWMGQQIAKGRGRSLLLSSGLVIGVGLVIVAIAPALAVFMLGWGVIGIGMAMGLYDALFAELGKNYGSLAKGAITQITLISGFATTITWPMLAWMEQQWGWRYACAGYGLLLWATIWPLYHLAFPKQPRTDEEYFPQLSPQLPDSPSTFQPGLFWLLVVNFTIAAVIMTAISIQLLAVLQAKGLSLAASISIGAFIGPCQVGVRLLEAIGPKKNPMWSAFLSAALVLVGLLLLGMDNIFATAGVILYSLGNGLRAVLKGVLPLELFGPTDYPVVLGRLARPVLIAQALTPVLGGYLVLKQGTLGLLGILVGLALLNVAITLAIRFRMRSPLLIPH